MAPQKLSLSPVLPLTQIVDDMPVEVVITPTTEELRRYARGNWYFMEAFTAVERELSVRRPVRVDTKGLPFNGQDLSAAMRNYALADAQRIPLELLALHPHAEFMLGRLRTVRQYDPEDRRAEF